MSLAYATKSNQVAAALRDTLREHLADQIPPEYEGGPDGGRLYLPAALVPPLHDNYLLQSGAATMRANLCPAICIDDKGSTQEEAYVGGTNLVEYKFDVEIWDQQRGAEDGRERINAWRDAIEACLDAEWTCREAVALCETESSDPAFAAKLDSNVLWIGVVHVRTLCYIGRGEPALT